MYPTVANQFPIVTRRLEGCTLYPYLDVKGKPTIADGCLIESFASFSAVAWAGNPSASQVSAGYCALLAQPAALLASRYAPVTTLRITQATCDAMLQSRLGLFVAYMQRQHFAEWLARGRAARRAVDGVGARARLARGLPALQGRCSGA